MEVADVLWNDENGSLVSLDGGGISFKDVGMSAKAVVFENLDEVSLKFESLENVEGILLNVSLNNEF